MAQDFGDDMGNALLNFVTRQTENYLRFGRGRERAFDWWQRHYKKEGNTPEQAKAMAEKQSSREQVVVPFGTSEEAAYYAQVCRENGTYAAAYTDKQGNGFLAFAKEDAKTVAGYAPQFKDVMARLDEQRITDALNHAEPVNKKTMDSLTELTGYPDLPAEDVTVIPVTIRYKDAPDKTYDVLFSEQDTENLNIDDSICFSGYSHKELTEMVGRETREDFDVISVGAPYKVHATQVKTDAPEKTYDVPGKDAPARSDRVATLRAEDTAIHTQNIRNAAQKAREDCTDFSDFERKMNTQGFGVTETSKGEVMAYEPASLNTLVALIGGGAYYGISHQTGADSKTESVQANDSKESGSDASAKDGSKSKEKSHTHDWSITYKTVHHDAVTHTEHVAPVYQNLTTYHTVCNECKQVIDGKADDHIKQTGHSGYSTNVPITDEVMVSEGYDKQVTDTPAYDETVIDKLVCTTCGATKDAPQATSDAAK